MNWKAVHLKHDIIYQVGNIPSSAYLEVADPCWVEVKLQAWEHYVIRASFIESTSMHLSTGIVLT